MPARSRSEDLRYAIEGSTWTHNSSPVFKIAAEGEYGTCDDFVGNPDGVNPFRRVRNRVTVGRIGGRYHTSPTTYREFSLWPFQEGMSPPSLGYGDLNQIALNNLAWTLIAKTNPSAPVVSVPNVIWEMRDLPSLVKGWNGSLLKQVAKGHLSWRWAIKPLIQDISTLADTVDYVSQRARMLKRLRDQGGIRLRAGLGSEEYETPWSSIYALHSSTGASTTIRGRDRTVRSQELWGTLRYKVTPNTQIPEEADALAALAHRITHGLTGHEALSVLWEMTPWSWFVDWFAGLGDILTATNNTVELTWADICIMQRRKSKREYMITDIPAGMVVEITPEQEVEDKRRYLASPFLPLIPKMPLLEWRKWSILASLNVLRRDQIEKSWRAEIHRRSRRFRGLGR